jgi:hypothetical protein
VIDADTALGKQLFDVAIRQAITQVPADGDRDYLSWETEPGERGRRCDHGHPCSLSRPGTANATEPLDALIAT